MITEVCREFGWKVEYVLNMPARRFFSVRKSMYELITDEKFSNYAELSDIQAISICDVKYQNALKSHYTSRVTGYVKRPSGRVFDVDQEAQREQLHLQLAAVFKQKKRLMGL